MMAHNVILIGPRGAGKTTVGVLLARPLETPFVDLDKRFRARARKPQHRP
jgi:shikimate kinase